MGLARKTRTRVETLLAWAFAFGLLFLVGAGAWFVLQAIGVLG